MLDYGVEHYFAHDDHCTHTCSQGESEVADIQRREYTYYLFKRGLAKVRISKRRAV